MQRSHHKVFMICGLRSALMVLLAVFAIAGSMQEIRATTMTAKMAVSMYDITGDASCDGCTETGMSATCDIHCVSSTAAILPTASIWRAFGANPRIHRPIPLSVGLTEPPLPQPPRS